jgi:hypothetical protein
MAAILTGITCFANKLSGQLRQDIYQAEQKRRSTFSAFNEKYLPDHSFTDITGFERFRKTRPSGAGINFAHGGVSAAEFDAAPASIPNKTNASLKC